MKNTFEKTSGDSDYEKKKIKNLEFFIEEVKYNIEVESYYFEYPEGIRNESYIEGYERNIVSKNSLLKLIKEIANRKNIDFTGIDDFNKIISGSTEIERELENIYNNVVKVELSRKFSEGKFPNRCYTHSINGYLWGEDAKISISNFKTDRMFVQKIYNPNRLVTQNFNHIIRGYDAPSTNKLRFGVFNQNFELIGDPKSQYDLEDELNSKDLFLATYKDKNTGEEGLGLNVTVPTKSFIQYDRTRYNSEKDQSYSYPTMGFCAEDTLKEETFFSQYLNKCLDIYVKIYESNKLREKNSIEQIKNILFLMLHHNKKRYFYDKNEFNEIIKKHNIRETIVEEMGDLSHDIELFIPVLLNNEEVPQLRWGHADFAQFLDSKGFNCLKFKHKDLIDKKLKI